MSSTDAIAVPTGGDQNRAGPLIAAYWSMMFFAVVIMSLRMWARKLTKSFGWDDWLMLMSLVMQLTLSGFVTKYALIGGTRHLYYLTAAEMEQVLKWSYILQSWGILSFTPSKASVALLIHRLMRPLRGWRFWILVVALTILVIANVSDSIFTFAQCDPPAALWDRSITNAKCWHPSVQANISLAQGSYNIFVDALLAIIPATFLYKLQMDFKKKLGLICLLGLGLLAAVAGSIKTSKLARLTARSDLTWQMYSLIIWSGVENWVVLMCGSVPPLKPLWTKYISNRKTGSEVSPSQQCVLRSDDVTLYAHSKGSKGLDRYSVFVTTGTTASSIDSIDKHCPV